MVKQETFGIKPGLRVLVTAGAAGIGRVVADAFSAAGAKIHVCDVETSKSGNSFARM